MADAEPWDKKFDQFQSSQDWKPTELPPEEEEKFRKWITSTAWFAEVKEEIAKDYGIKPSELKDEDALKEVLGGDYDYRGAWKSGATKMTRDAGDGKLHWPSEADGKMLKSPKHPTAWKEFFMKETGENPDDIGLDTLDKAKAWQKKRAADPGYVMYPSMRKVK